MKFITGMYYEDELYSLKGTILAENTKSSNLKIFKYYRNREGSVRQHLLLRMILLV